MVREFLDDQLKLLPKSRIRDIELNKKNKRRQKHSGLMWLQKIPLSKRHVTDSCTRSVWDSSSPLFSAELM